MKKTTTIWRVEYRAIGDGIDGESKGFTYHVSRRQAKAACEDASSETETIVESLTVEISKAGIVSALNLYGDHPNNG